MRRAHTTNMDFMLLGAIPAFLLLLALFVLLVPLRAELFVTADAAAVFADVRVAFFPFQIHRLLRLSVLDTPYFSLWIYREDGTARSIPLRLPKADEKKKAGAFFAYGKAIRIEKLETVATVGCREDAAATALLCGACRCIGSALQAVLRGRFDTGSILLDAKPAFGRDRLAWSALCMIRIRFADIIGIWISERGRNA